MCIRTHSRTQEQYRAASSASVQWTSSVVWRYIHAYASAPLPHAHYTCGPMRRPAAAAAGPRGPKVTSRRAQPSQPGRMGGGGERSGLLHGGRGQGGVVADQR